MDVIEAIHGRRSIRAYRPEPVERRLIRELIWVPTNAISISKRTFSNFAHSVFVIALIVMAVGSVLITYAISIK